MASWEKLESFSFFLPFFLTSMLCRLSLCFPLSASRYLTTGSPSLFSSAISWAFVSFRTSEHGVPLGPIRVSWLFLYIGPNICLSCLSYPRLHIHAIDIQCGAASHVQSVCLFLFSLLFHVVCFVLSQSPAQYTSHGAGLGAYTRKNVVQCSAVMSLSARRDALCAETYEWYFDFNPTRFRRIGSCLPWFCINGVTFAVRKCP
jgi:hypothetical protein